jgi:propionate catabolism operon transcriptional regulator
VPNIVAVGYRRINKMLHELVPAFASQAHVDVLDVGFEQAVAQIRQLQASQGVDVVVAAGANGAYLRQHLETPVVLVKVGGFDLMRALAQAKRLSSQIGLVTYEGMAPDLAPYADLFQVRVVQRSYQTEDEAKLGVQTLQEQGIGVVVGTGTVADQADALGLKGVFLYSMDAVRGALEDAVEVARASRIELAKRERLATILTQLSDGVIAVDVHERIETINPAMAQWLGVHPTQWQGRQLSDVCPELSLQQTLRQGTPDVEKIDQVKGKALIVNRMPIVEQGRLTGAVLTCQDPIRIQRVDRHIRSRIKPGALAARHQLDTFLGDSPAAVKLRQLAAQCARSSATVMLVGESGTGKELIAQGIHLASDRRDMPFVAVNCAAVTESLLESELFGYEDGAFTGARRGGKIGLFEAAHNGTIFLDEVGEMPLALQSRLLRVLQAREVLRVGATEPTPVNVRVIAATHRHLRTRVEQGLFRLDLLYRLDILRLEVPALRQRTQDISLIASTLHQRVCERLQLHPQPTEALLATLIHHASAYAWPGNVRELENVVERLVVFRTGHQTPHAENSQVLQALMPELFNAQALLEAPTAVQKDTQVSLKLSRLQQAQQDIQTTLLECGGDKALAASKLGISRTTLWRKLRQG